MGTRIIEAQGIHKFYTLGEQRLHVLKDVSLTVEHGEFLSILGASGSGKSTLMNILGCMDEMDSGSYWLDGVAVHQADSGQLSRLRNEKIGFIFQKYHLMPQYSVLQNVLMPLLIRVQSRAEALPQAEAAIERVGLADRMKHRPSELSGGQQQRVAIARALVTRPVLLLADEPTGALDSHTGREILQLFQELHDSGNTIIQITHDMHVAQFSRRIVRLTDGVLQTESAGT